LAVLFAFFPLFVVFAPFVVLVSKFLFPIPALYVRF